MGKCCLSVGKGWKPTDAIETQRRAIGREWGALKIVTDMWNVWKRVKIYQKHRQWQDSSSASHKEQDYERLVDSLFRSCDCQLQEGEQDNQLERTMVPFIQVSDS